MSFALKKNHGFVPQVVGLANLRFIVIGCGGTGGYLIPNLARILSIFNSSYGYQHSLTLIDADKVEKHNIQRQNFISEDIGMNKAEVLACRYGAAFNLNIQYIDEYLTANNVQSIISQDSIVIGCVDNNKTRHLLSNEVKGKHGSVYLDAGNEQFAGQVMFYTNRVLVGNQAIPIALQTVVDYFNLPNNDKSPDEMSCDELALHAPQNIATNIMAGNLLFQYCNTMVMQHHYYKKINPTFSALVTNIILLHAPVIKNTLIYFDALTGATTTLPDSTNGVVSDKIAERHKIKQGEISRWLEEMKPFARSIVYQLIKEYGIDPIQYGDTPLELTQEPDIQEDKSQKKTSRSCKKTEESLAEFLSTDIPTEAPRSEPLPSLIPVE